MEVQNCYDGDFFKDRSLKSFSLSALIHLSVILMFLAGTKIAPFKSSEFHREPILFVTLNEFREENKEDHRPASKTADEKTSPSYRPEPVSMMITPEPTKTIPSIKKNAPISQTPRHQKVEKAKTKPQPPMTPKVNEQIPPATDTPPLSPPATTTTNDTVNIAAADSGLSRSNGEGGGETHDGPTRSTGKEGGGGGDAKGLGTGVLSFGSGENPGFLKKVLPEYPLLAKKLGKEGIVRLLVTIYETGRIVDVEVLERAGFGFDEEAVAAVKSSAYRPAMRDGRPISCKALLPVVFKLAR